MRQPGRDESRRGSRQGGQTAQPWREPSGERAGRPDSPAMARAVREVGASALLTTAATPKGWARCLSAPSSRCPSVPVLECLRQGAGNGHNSPGEI